MKKILLIAFIVLAGTVSAQYTYEGEKNSEGLPDGEGVMKWSNARFKGTFRNEDPVKGTFTHWGKGLHQHWHFYHQKTSQRAIAAERCAGKRIC